MWIWLAVVGVLLGLPTVYAAWRGAPYVPTPHHVVEKALAMAGLKEGELLIDCGCGDGRVLLAAARRGARAAGYELSPPLYWLARWRCRRYRGQITVFWRDGFKADFSRADVVFAYLMPRTMPRLLRAVKRSCRRKSLRLVSYAFPLKGIKPLQEVKLPGAATLRLYRL